MNKLKQQITKLARPEQCGDWHDKPLRWQVQSGEEIQKFATRKDARLYAKIRAKVNSPNEAHVAFVLA